METTAKGLLKEELTAEDVIALTNSQKRSDLVQQTERWPVWVSVPQLKMTVRRILLPDGTAFCATTIGEEIYPSCCYITPGGTYSLRQFHHFEFVNYLKALRKQLLDERRKAKQAL